MKALVSLLAILLLAMQLPPPPSPPPPIPEWLSPGAYAKYEVRATAAYLVGGDLAIGCEGTFEWTVVKLAGQLAYVKVRFDLRLGERRVTNETTIAIDTGTMYATADGEPVGYVLLWMNPELEPGVTLKALTWRGIDYDGTVKKLIARLKPIYTPYGNYSSADVKCVVVEITNTTRACFDFDAETGLLIRARTLGDLVRKLVGVDEFIGDPYLEGAFFRLLDTNVAVSPSFGIPIRAAILAILLAVAIFLVRRVFAKKSP